MNDSNLQKFGDGSRSKETEKAMQEKGGKNSGAVRRRKRSEKQLALVLLNMPATPDAAVKMEKMGIPKDDQTNQMAVLVAILQKALEGDVKAALFLRDISGENPADKLHALEVKQKFNDEEQRLALEREKFEYLKDRDVVNNPEYEYLDDVEAEIYGDDLEKSEQEGRETE